MEALRGTVKVTNREQTANACLTETIESMQVPSYLLSLCQCDRSNYVEESTA